MLLPLTLAAAACGSDHSPPPMRDSKPKKPVPPPKPAAPPSPIGDVSIRPQAVQRMLDPTVGVAPLPTPEAGDWLAEHAETPQTFDDYLHSDANVPTDQRHTLYLLPIGTFPKDASPSLEALQQIVHAFYTLDVRVLPAVPLRELSATSRTNPSTRKRQLLAPDILRWLTKRLPDDAYALMAVTMEDLYPEPSWNFVFGMASLQARVGVQSFARQDPAFFGDPRTPGWQQLALRRAARTLLHEIAHMFGLSHCTFYACVVNGSNHQAEADRSPLHACPVDLHKLWWAIRFDPIAREATLAATFRALHFDEEASYYDRRVAYLRDGTR